MTLTRRSLLHNQSWLLIPDPLNMLDPAHFLAWFPVIFSIPWLSQYHYNEIPFLLNYQGQGLCLQYRDLDAFPPNLIKPFTAVLYLQSFIPNTVMKPHCASCSEPGAGCINTKMTQTQAKKTVWGDREKRPRIVLQITMGVEPSLAVSFVKMVSLQSLFFFSCLPFPSLLASEAWARPIPMRI